ncbi:MAG: ABC transporter permease [Bacteroidales bacterium]|jgi:ABC-2 type transport system permease protein|nr:ABC transporter permease [Bacteroidales bacterium]
MFIHFIKKEFFHIFRDIRTMMMLLLMPVVQLIIFGFAITTEINHTPVAVLDHSNGELSRRLIAKIDGSRYFTLQEKLQHAGQLEETFRQGKAKLIAVFPSGFDNDLYHNGSADIQLLADASDPNEASTVISYAGQVIAQYVQELNTGNTLPYVIRPEVKMLYNPQLKSAYNFVPGIMGLILMLICAMMTSISIVREKEQGTMEVLLVSPARPVMIIIAKAVPYLMIAMIDVVSILLLSVFVLHVPISGSVILILLLSFVFTLSALSLGLLISSVAKTQQAAMLASGVGLMLPSILLSGLIFPVENMPWILRILSNIIPAKWFIVAIKDVMIKGLGIGAIAGECGVLLLITVILLLVSVKKFKIRVE